VSTSSHTAAALPLSLLPPEDTPFDVEDEERAGHCAEVRARRAYLCRLPLIPLTINHPLYEDDKPEGVGPYGQAKIQAEISVWSTGARSMVVPVIRPKSFVAGEVSVALRAVLRLPLDVGHNSPMVIGSGNNRYQLRIDVEDLCEADALNTAPEERANDTFNIGGGVH